MIRLKRPSHLFSWRLCAFARTKKKYSRKACLRQAGRQGLVAERQDSRQKLVPHLGTWVF